MSDEKTYVPRSSAKQITFERSGKTIIKLGFHAESLIAFIKANTNERGYVNLGISQRKEVGQHGDTHCVWLDTWKPGQTAPKATPEQLSRGVSQMRQAAAKPPPEEDDVPF